MNWQFQQFQGGSAFQGLTILLQKRKFEVDCWKLCRNYSIEAWSCVLSCLGSPGQVGGVLRRGVGKSIQYFVAELNQLRGGIFQGLKVEKLKSFDLWIEFCDWVFGYFQFVRLDIFGLDSRLVKNIVRIGLPDICAEFNLQFKNINEIYFEWKIINRCILKIQLNTDVVIVMTLK